jgi:hypothetical protein
MDLKYQIICHPNELFYRNNRQITEWLEEIISDKNITIELPILNDIYYPIYLHIAPKLNGISRYEILKKAFYFYMESEIDTDFLMSVGIKVDTYNKCWYDYCKETMKEIKSIEKIDDDEFILIPSSLKHIPITKYIDNINVDKDICILCKKCSKLVLVKEINIQNFIEKKYNCHYCGNILIDNTFRYNDLIKK